MKSSRLVLAIALVVAAFAGVAEESSSSDKVVAVESKNVCMINDRSMANEQIAVDVDGKTYYGCCAMCKERLVKDESSRFAIDPVSGSKVDKAKAVIGALPGAKVLYFESLVNLERYNAGARAESH
jgi:YHS domain-containing protein